MQWLDDSALWERLAPGAVETELDGLRIKVVGYEDLVHLKQRAGRPSDVEDLVRLRQARGEST